MSVIIPVYNRLEELARALDSLVNQTQKNFEVIVVDDGSIENIKLVTDKYHSELNVNLIKIENSGGPARPRNVGIRASKTKWISLLDSDDWWRPQRIFEMCLAINNNPEYDIFYHKLKIVCDDRSIKWWSTKNIGFSLSKNAFVDLMIRGNALPNSSVVIRKSIFQQLGYLNEASDFASVEDFDYWLKASNAKCKFYFLNKSLGSYWLSNSGISANPLKTIDCNRVILDKYSNYLSNENKKAAISKYDYFVGSILYGANRPSEALTKLKNAKHLTGFVLKSKRLLKILMIYMKLKKK